MDSKETSEPQPQTSFDPTVLIVIGIAIVAAIVAGVFLT